MKEKKLKEWRQKVKEKDRKEQERKEKEKIDREIRENWEIVKWTTNYIGENNETWVKEREAQEHEAERELQEWRKMKRKEKIRKLQEKWRKEKEEKDINYMEEKETTSEKESTILERKEKMNAMKEIMDDEISLTVSSVMISEHNFKGGGPPRGPFISIIIKLLLY